MLSVILLLLLGGLIYFFVLSVSDACIVFGYSRADAGLRDISAALLVFCRLIG